MVATAQSDRVFAFRSIRVLTGRLVCEVAIDDDSMRYATPAIAEALCACRPNFRFHSCVNDQDAPFASIMGKTSLPHLLEHLVIDIQTERCPNDASVFVGTTEWIDEDAGLARVQVSFADDLEALRALREAARILEAAVLRYRA